MLPKETKHINKKDSELEAEYGRRYTRTSIDTFIKRVWDANHARRRVEKVLRPASREEEVERVQKKAEEARKRNARLNRVTKVDGYKDIEEMLKTWEAYCYYNLRFPELRKENVSRDYYHGFQNGALWIVEGFRKDIQRAITSLKDSREE